MVTRQMTSAASETKEMDLKISPENDDVRRHIGEDDKKKNINFLRGWPATSLLPAEALRKASQTALSDPDIWVPGLEYAPDPGYQPLREALAEWLGRFYGDVASPLYGPISSASSTKRGGGRPKDIKAEADRITITGGASQSLACLLQSFTDPAHTLAIWVVAPCYFLACPILMDAGFAGRLRAVPEDEEGVDIQVLEREMCAVEKQHQQSEYGEGTRRYKDPGANRKTYLHIVYCVPAFSNPSGLTMTLARRKELVDLARRHDALVICDDVYDMLQWRIPPSFSSSPSPNQDEKHTSTHPHKALLPRLADIDLALGRSPHDPPGRHFGHAVSNGSFSKLVAPGTRTGWTYSTPDFALGNSLTGSTRSGGAASQFAATVVCQLLLPLSGNGGNVEGEDVGSREEQKKEEKEKGEHHCILDKHIRTVLVPTYARRHAILMRAIREHLVPLGLSVREHSLRDQDNDGGGVYGGYFVWLTLPPFSPPSSSSSSSSIAAAAAAATITADVNGEEIPNPNPNPNPKSKPRPFPPAQAIATRCRADANLTIGNGELFAVHGDEGVARFEDAIRLCFAWLGDEGDLRVGVERLGRVIRSMLEEGEKRSWDVSGGMRGLGGVDGEK